MPEAEPWQHLFLSWLSSPAGAAGSAGPEPRRSGTGRCAGLSLVAHSRCDPAEREVAAGAGAGCWCPGPSLQRLGALGHGLARPSPPAIAVMALVIGLIMTNDGHRSCFQGNPAGSPAPAQIVRPRLRQRCPPCPVSVPGSAERSSGGSVWCPGSRPSGQPGGASGGLSQPRPQALLLFVPHAAPTPLPSHSALSPAGSARCLPTAPAARGKHPQKAKRCLE